MPPAIGVIAPATALGPTAQATIGAESGSSLSRNRRRPSESVRMQAASMSAEHASNPNASQASRGGTPVAP